MKYSTFEDLPIWQKARVLAKYIFETTSKEPFCYGFKFHDQIRASSGSVMDNIAEGLERNGNKLSTSNTPERKETNSEIPNFF